MILFLLVGVSLGWTIKSYLDNMMIPKAKPLHPEFFDSNGDLVPDEVLALTIHPGMYEDFNDEYKSLFEDDDSDEDGTPVNE